MTEQNRQSCSGRRGGPGGAGGAVYGLGLIGALVYYIQHAHGFWSVVLGILKALVWPAFLVYDALKHLAS
jgi:hypothetical protein